jgi:hypothetical protein
MACVEMAWIKFGFGSALVRGPRHFVVVMGSTAFSGLRTRGLVFVFT